MVIELLASAGRPRYCFIHGSTRLAGVGCFGPPLEDFGLFLTQPVADLRWLRCLTIVFDVKACLLRGIRRVKVKKRIAYSTVKG